MALSTMNTGVWSYASAALVFALLAVALLFVWRNRLHAWPLLLAAAASAAWAALVAYQIQAQAPVPAALASLELLRDWAWLFFLAQMLRMADARNRALNVLGQLVHALPVLLLLLVVVISLLPDMLPSWLSFDVRVLGHVLIALLGLVLIEQVLRNTHRQEQWGIKFFCLAIGGVFAYDFYLFSDALLFRQIDPVVWYSRGFVNAAVVPLLAWALVRTPPSKTNVLFSRDLVFYSTGLMIAGGYLVVVALAGYILGRIGGDWGGVLRHVFVFVALLALLLLIFSGQMRSRLRVFIDKHLLDYRYDYREEWLGLIRELSLQDSPLPLEARALRALAEMVDSPAGMLWIKHGDRDFKPVQTFSMGESAGLSEPADGSLASFLETWQWVINLEERDIDPELYQGLELPHWLRNLDTAWLVVPLMLQNRLYGFAVLGRPRAAREFNWEDIDLLKTAGRQIAIHLAQQQAAMALAESRQFEAFNRFSAYVVHDLKNLVSQLALVVQNAQKHRHNPEFMDDAIGTVDNAVARMNRLLAQLRSGKVAVQAQKPVDLGHILRTVCEEKRNGRPSPQLRLQAENASVAADADRLVAVIGHVVQNAQDATPDDGKVEVRLSQQGTLFCVEVEDTGCGMDADFVKDRLFKPFDTTKGLTGMGIGAHEVKAFAEELGGYVAVDSAPGNGTVFRIYLPRAAGEAKAMTEGDRQGGTRDTTHC